MEDKNKICPICEGSGLIGVSPLNGADFEDWGCWLCKEGLVDTVKLGTYQGLTELIQRINEFRKKYGRSWGLRKDRDKQNLISGYWVSRGNGILLECCDCGLSHRLYEDERGTHCIPERPRDYQYRQ